MNVKQVIIIRKDLKMRRGKEISQGAHASMKVILDEMTPTAKLGTNQKVLEIDEELDDWINGIFTKICVRVDSEEDLLLCYNSARLANLRCSLIEDVGLTEFNGVKTLTAVAIGPNESDKIDLITGNLKLL